MSMASSSSDSWVKEYNEALKLADDITTMISARSSFPTSVPEAQRYASAIRRKTAVLGSRLDSLQSLLSMLPGKHHVTEKEMNRRKDMLAKLKEQLDGLKKLEETLRSTCNNIEVEMNEKLDQETKITDELEDQHADVTDSLLRRVQKNLAILDKRTNGGCSCLCMAFVIWMLVKYL